MPNRFSDNILNSAGEYYACSMSCRQAGKGRQREEVLTSGKFMKLLQFRIRDGDGWVRKLHWQSDHGRVTNIELLQHPVLHW